MELLLKKQCSSSPSPHILFQKIRKAKPINCISTNWSVFQSPWFWPNGIIFHQPRISLKSPGSHVPSKKRYRGCPFGRFVRSPAAVAARRPRRVPPWRLTHRTNGARFFCSVKMADKFPGNCSHLLIRVSGWK